VKRPAAVAVARCGASRGGRARASRRPLRPLHGHRPVQRSPSGTQPLPVPAAPDRGPPLVQVLQDRAGGACLRRQDAGQADGRPPRSPVRGYRRRVAGHPAVDGPEGNDARAVRAAPAQLGDAGARPLGVPRLPHHLDHRRRHHEVARRDAIAGPVGLHAQAGLRAHRDDLRLRPVRGAHRHQPPGAGAAQPPTVEQAHPRTAARRRPDDSTRAGQMARRDRLRVRTGLRLSCVCRPVPPTRTDRPGRRTRSPDRTLPAVIGSGTTAATRRPTAGRSRAPRRRSARRAPPCPQTPRRPLAGRRGRPRPAGG
jgi:hypothetical protein